MLFIASGKRARQGAYSEGLAMLIEPSVWRGITLNDYTLWANQIWHILVLRASRRWGHLLSFPRFKRNLNSS